MCLKSGQPDALMGVGLLAAEGSLARRCGNGGLRAKNGPANPDGSRSSQSRGDLEAEEVGGGRGGGGELVGGDDGAGADPI